MALWQTYHTPSTIGEALHLLRQYDGKAQIIAGGTDLIIDMQTQHHPPVEALVDVTRIEGLDTISIEEGWVRIGAAVTHSQIEQSALLRQHGRALVESCSVVGGPQVRNVATLGGNVAHALPAADGTIGLLALDAEVQVCTLAEVDTLDSLWQPLLSVFAGPGRNTLGADQMLAAFRFPMIQPRRASAFDRIMRPQGVALPILGVAAQVTLDEAQGRVVAASIAVGPAGPVPFRATEAEAVLTGGDPFSPALIEEAVGAAQRRAQLRASRYRAGKEYRHEMLAVLLRRVLGRAVARARGEDS